jgi:hypothetical protein
MGKDKGKKEGRERGAGGDDHINFDQILQKLFETKERERKKIYG